MSSDDFVDSLLKVAGEIIQPLKPALQSPGNLLDFLASFGWALTDSQASSIIAAFGSIANDVENFENASAAQIVSDAETLINDIVSLLKSGPPPGLDQFWATFPDDLLDYLVYTYVQQNQQQIYGALSFLGILSQDPKPADAATGRGAYVRLTVNWDIIPTILTQPQNIFPSVYQWGTAFDYAAFLSNSRNLLEGFIVNSSLSAPPSALLNLYYDPSSTYRPSIQELSASPLQLLDDSGNAVAGATLTLSIMPIPPDSNNKAAPDGFVFFPTLAGSASTSFEIIPGMATLSLTGGFGAATPIRLEVHPNGVKVVPPTGGSVSALAELTLSSPVPLVLLGTQDSTHIELSQAHTSLSAQGPDASDIEYKVEVGLDQSSVVIDLGGADSFLTSILGNGKQSVAISLAVGWSSKTGFYVNGQASLVITIPVHQSIAGVIDIETVYLSLSPDTSAGANGVDLVVAASGGLQLGPIAATVDRLGLETKLDIVDFSKGQIGNLGKFNLSFGFKPPDGLGLAVDAGPVTGGGYIQFDSSKGEYAGILQLGVDIPVITIEITVIGLLDTKLPGGVPGYSFLLIVTSEFTPIQLGFGFTLNGVGGLAGINRSVSLDALRSGLKSHTLDSLLFPPDPIIPRAAQIISMVSSVFPVTVGSDVFGIMLELGWGEPQIIDAEMGIVLELPNPVNIALIGGFKAGLPTVEDPDLALILFQIDILGIIDFQQEQFTLQGTLYDSRILFYQLSGGMSMLLDWSSNPQFVLSVGGFNPQFPIPPGFQTPDRLSLSIGSGSVNLAMTSYYAVTSNSVQFGSDTEVNASGGGFSLNGHFTFDVLFTFNPFAFIFDVSAGVSIMHGGSTLFSIQLNGSLSGPKPLHVQGSASFHILFISVSIPVNFTIGDSGDSQPAPQVAVLPILVAALQAKSAWSAQLPEAVGPLVTLAKAPAGDQTLFVHPMGSLTARQKVVPLDTTITKFGNDAPSDGASYTIAGITANTLNQPVPPDTDVQDPFARGQFQSLTNSQQISDPSFEEMPSGTHLGSPDFQVGGIPEQDLKLTYDTYYIETPIQPATLVKDLYRPSSAVLAAGVGLGAAANSKARLMGNWKYVPPGVSPIVSVKPQLYTIVNAQTLAPTAGLAPVGGSSLTAADSALAGHLSAHPEDVGLLQIVPVQEAQYA